MSRASGHGLPATTKRCRKCGMYDYPKHMVDEMCRTCQRADMNCVFEEMATEHCEKERI